MIIQSSKVYVDEKLQPLQVDIENNCIKGIYQYGQFKVDKDYGDLMILPGLCDVHAHGYGGESVCDATVDFCEKWCKYLPNEGITSVVAGVSSHPKDKLLTAMSNIAEYMENPKEGTHIIGIYEEGPFISLGKERGAQSAEYCIVPDRKVIDEFNAAAKGHLIYVMVAPEMLKGNYDVIDYCRSQGIAVSFGHTAASFDICQEAVKHGVNSFTHTYNGMKGLHHREPGVVGAAMYFDNCYAELIADGVHVEKHAANILAKCKGKDRLIIITDSISLKGLPYGEYKEPEDLKVTTICKDDVCRLADGTLAGSARKLNDNLYYAIKEEEIPFVTAVNACTINPMRLLGINDKGLIRKGYKADLAIFDEQFKVKEVYIDGKTQDLNNTCI